jgi:DNA mismatch repair protein MutL
LSEISVFDLSKIDVETLSFLRMNQQYVFAVSNGYLLMIHLQRAVFKVMFERVKRMFSQQQPTKQMLLFPEILAFSAEQEVVMENLVDELIAIGFELENLDLNQWQLTAIPADLSAFSASVLISDMVSEVMIDGVLDKQRLQYEMSFSLAKRMTESFRQVNSDEELKLILGELFVSNSPNYTPDGKMIVRVSTPMDFFGE